MAEQNQETVSAPANLPSKRKRGRPRMIQAATNSSHGIQVTPNQVDLAAFSGMRPQTLPKIDFDPTDHSRSVCFAHHPEANATQPNSAAASSQKTKGLLGQSVCGTLDGTFEAGYLLTVKVAGTDHVLKGIVFDPLRCVPISEENDIAPLIPMARPIGNLHLAVEKPSLAIISVPVQPASSSFDVVLPVQMNEPPADSKTANQLLTPPNLPLSAADNSSVINTNETIPKVTESAPQNAAVDESQAEDSLAPFLANKENPQMTFTVSSDNRSRNVIEPRGAESSADINTVEISGPNQRQKGPFEELLHGSVPQHCEQASDRVQSCRDPKLQDELRNP